MGHEFVTSFSYEMTKSWHFHKAPAILYRNTLRQVAMLKNIAFCLPLHGAPFTTPQSWGSNVLWIPWDLSPPPGSLKLWGTVLDDVDILLQPYLFSFTTLKIKPAKFLKFFHVPDPLRRNGPKSSLLSHTPTRIPTVL